MSQVSLRVALPEPLRSEIEYVECAHAPADTVAAVRETLLLSAVLGSYTNYALVHGNQRLAATAPLSAYFAPGTHDVALVPCAYSLRDVYAHLVKFRENIGLNFFDAAHRAHGLAGGLSRFHALGLKRVDAHASQNGDSPEPLDTKPVDTVTLSDGDKAAVHAAVALLADAAPQPESFLSKWTVPIKALALLPWSVPPHQRAKGDLLYIQVTTLEAETVHVTCHVSGFFVNLSGAAFNPAPKTSSRGTTQRAYVLADLVKALSPQFTKVLAANTQLLAANSQFVELYLIPMLVPRFPYKVAESQLCALADQLRTQLPVYAHGVDRADDVRDWNEEYQVLKEMPRQLLAERIVRERLLSSTMAAFSRAATATAVDIANGNVPPMNPDEPPHRHVFLRNNIFYCHVANTGSFDDCGGDDAARYCAGKDVAAVRFVNRADIAAVSTLLLAVVDYCGARILCQAPIPGVFGEQTDDEGNMVEKVAYGVSEETGAVHHDAKFAAALADVAELFRLKKHTVDGTELVVAKDTKGVYGTDGRKYVMEMHSHTPLDICFLEAAAEAPYPHRKPLVRLVAVEEWYKRRAAATFKAETERLEKEGKLAEQEHIAIPVDHITFDPDAFNGSPEGEAGVREISAFVTQHLIPEFLDEVATASLPFDGEHLTAFMHRAGINMRYLGYLIKECNKRLELLEATKAVETKAKEDTKKATEVKEAAEAKEDAETKEDSAGEAPEAQSKIVWLLEKANLECLRTLCNQEVLARAAKHVLRREARSVPPPLRALFLAHFHNCLLGLAYNAAPEAEVDGAIKRLCSDEELAFTKLTPETVQAAVKTEALARFRVSPRFERLAQVHREVAHKCGIQWRDEDYHFAVPGKHVTFEPPRSTTFVPLDVMALVPKTKDTQYRCLLVDEVHETALRRLKAGEQEVAVSIMGDLTLWYRLIYGLVHHETAAFYSSLAQFYSDCKMHAEASIAGRKAALLHERLCGDGYETINSYIKASYYDSLHGDHVSGFVLNCTAMQLWSSVYGATHPNTLSTLCNFAPVLQAVGLVADAKRVMEQAIDLSVQLNGEVSPVSCTIMQRLSLLFVQTRELPTALKLFKKTRELCVQLAGPSDPMTRNCTDFIGNIERYLAAPKPEAPKPKQQTKLDPKLAAKSVDEIMAFIGGEEEKPQKKKRGKK